MTRSSREAFDRLYDVVTDRKRNPKESSYTSLLFSQGIEAIGAKVLEEAGELVEAARGKRHEEMIHEAADLIYHTWVLLAEADVTLEQVREELAKREGVGGLEEKKRRT